VLVSPLQGRTQVVLLDLTGEVRADGKDLAAAAEEENVRCLGCVVVCSAGREGG